MPLPAPRLSLLLAVAALATTACDGKAPPKGDQLRLRAGKDAFCLFDRECASDECRLGKCTEKVDKVGLGEKCESSQYCEKGLYCDVSAKKCAPAVRCEDLRDPLETCIETVYIAFKPSQKRRLQRMRASSRKRFLERMHQIVYNNLCRATRGGGLPYAKAVKLLAATKEKDCGKFAAAIVAATNN